MVVEQSRNSDFKTEILTKPEEDSIGSNTGAQEELTDSHTSKLGSLDPVSLKDNSSIEVLASEDSKANDVRFPRNTPPLEEQKESELMGDNGGDQLRLPVDEYFMYVFDFCLFLTHCKRR